MPNQDAVLSMPAPWFKDFSKAIAKFNKRTVRLNTEKGTKFATVNRFPVTATMRVPGHPTDTVTVKVAIRDRSKVLWQELSEILDHYRDVSFDLSGRRTAKPLDDTPLQPVTGVMAQAAAKTTVQPRPDLDAMAIAASQSMPGKPVSSPVEPRSTPQWGLWVPCADEATARAAAGFLAAVAKVGQPQVECRG